MGYHFRVRTQTDHIYSYMYMYMYTYTYFQKHMLVTIDYFARTFLFFPPRPAGIYHYSSWCVTYHCNKTSAGSIVPRHQKDNTPSSPSAISQNSAKQGIMTQWWWWWWCVSSTLHGGGQTQDNTEHYILHTYIVFEAFTLRNLISMNILLIYFFFFSINLIISP